MKPTLEGLTADFTRLIGPEAFAKAEAAIAAAKAAAEAGAKLAAEKAAAAAAAAKAAAEKAAAEKAATALPGSGGSAAVDGVPAPRLPATGAATPRGDGAAPTTAIPPATRAAPAAPAAGATPVAPRPSPAPVANPAARPTPPAAPAPASVPTLPVQTTAHAAKGYDLDATVAANQVIQAAELLDRAGFALDTITGVDWIAQNEMEVVYDYFHPTGALRVVVRTRVPRATPELPSITSIFPGANWHERETHDFFGIRFTGHPNLKPFLLPEDADFHPLRKDYQP